MSSPGRRLREAWANGPIMIPGVFNALSAKMAERLGFPAIYLSGGALSAGTFGLPDVGLVTLTEFAVEVNRLAEASSLPLLCDADTGFGQAVNVERTVQAYEKAGAAGLHLEDQVLPKRCGHLTGKSLVGVPEMVSKIRAATMARRDADFVIVARTDARSVDGLDSALDRARTFVQAGADMIFPEALETREEFERFGREIHVPLIANMTEFGRSPLLPLSELGEMGFKAALYPLTAFRVAMKAAEEALRTLLREQSQGELIGHMQSRAELYDLLGYTEFEERDRSYFDRS